MTESFSFPIFNVEIRLYPDLLKNTKKQKGGDNQGIMNLCCQGKKCGMFLQKRSGEWIVAQKNKGKWVEVKKEELEEGVEVEIFFKCLLCNYLNELPEAFIPKDLRELKKSFLKPKTKTASKKPCKTVS